MTWHLPLERSSSAEQQAFAQRITEAINQCKASQGTIAEYCKVTRQAVTNWKKTGQIGDIHLRNLSIVTGYSLRWLIYGQGPKLAADAAQAQHCACGCQCRQDVQPDTAIQKLVSSIEYARANGKLNDHNLAALTSFVESLGGGQ